MTGDSSKKDKDDDVSVPGDGSGLVGPYRLVREIARGGMGIVYEATDERSGTRVALKLMSRHLLQAEPHRKRFEREMVVATMLGHPGITGLLDYGDHKGRPYYVMEYVEGWPLGSVPREDLLRLSEQGRAESASEIEKGALSPGPSGGDEKSRDLSGVSREGVSIREKTRPAVGKRYFYFVAGLAIQAAEALHYAHEQGVIHRDIKPSNLMLTPEGKIKILDFGLAKAIEFETLTTTGDFLGTPAYMSPEQAAGETSQIDHRTDIYSLGITFYELLTSIRPFTGETRILTSAIINKEPVEPRKLNRQIPRALNAVVSKAIEKKREDRYQSAMEFADDLRRYVGGRKPKARQGSLGWRLARVLRKRRREALLVSGSLLAAAIAFVVFVVYPWLKSAQYKALIAAAADASDNGRFDIAVSNLEKARRWKNTAQVKLRLWKARDSWKQLLPNSIAERANVLGVSPGGNLIAAGYPDGSVRLWDADSKRQIPEPVIRHQGGVTALGFSRDENLLASANVNGDVVVWDIANRKKVGFWQGTVVAIRSLAFLPGEAQLFMTDERGRITVRDVRGEPEGQRTTHESSDKLVWRLIKPNPVGGVFAAVAEDQAGETWAGAFRMSSAAPMFSVRLASRLPSAIAASESGDLLALGYPDGAIALHREGEDTPQAFQKADQRPVKDLWLLQEDKKLLVCYNSGAMVVWDIAQRRQTVMIGSACENVTAVAAAANGKWAALAPAVGGVQPWRADSDQMQVSARVFAPTHPFTQDAAMQCAVAFSAHGEFLASGDQEGWITVWETKSGQVVSSFNHCKSLVTAMAFSPKKEGWLAYANDALDPKDRAIWICDVTTGQEIHRFSDQPASDQPASGRPAVVQSLAFHQGGRLLASGDRNSCTTLWDVESFARIRSTQLPRPSRRQVITGLRFAATKPDLLIAWSGDGNAWFWNVPSLRAARQPFKYEKPEGIMPFGAAIGPTGSRLAAVSDKGHIGIWDFKKKRKIEFTPYGTGQEGVRCLAFSDDGEIIASASASDMAVRLWDVKLEEEAIRLSLEPDAPACMVFDRSSSRLAVGLANGRVVLYDFSSP